MDQEFTECMIPTVLKVLSNHNTNIIKFALCANIPYHKLRTLERDAPYLGTVSFSFMCLSLNELCRLGVKRNCIIEALKHSDMATAAEELEELEDWTVKTEGYEQCMSEEQIRNYLFDNQHKWLQIGVMSGIPMSTMMTIHIDGMPTCSNKVHLVFDWIKSNNLFPVTSVLISNRDI